MSDKAAAGDKPAAAAPAAAGAEVSAAPAAAAASASASSAGDAAAPIQDLFHHMALRRRPPVDESSKAHGFWDKQPVPKLAEKPGESSAIEVKEVKDVRAKPYKLPGGFEWCEVDPSKDDKLDELYKLLAENYVEDDDAMFRFNYKPEFLRWALTAPGFFVDWMVGVRHVESGNLVAFISGIPVHTRVRDDAMPMCEINFLCVHKELRDKRLAPKLIKEVTRRVNLRNIWQAVYTAGVVVPSPVADCQYFHRTLNARKLLDIGFTRLGPRMTRMRFERLQKLPDASPIEGWRAMQKGDIPAVTKILNAYLSRFALHLRFTDEEVKHWFMPREGVVSAFVVANKVAEGGAAEASAGAGDAAAAAGAGGDDAAAAAAAEEEGADDELTAVTAKGVRISGFASYYHLPSSVLRNKKYTDLCAGYSFYNVAGGGLTLTQLVQSALIEARNEGLDVFNALRLMQNASFFRDLKFGSGDGTLHYYLYNWKCAKMNPEEVGIVLL